MLRITQKNLHTELVDAVENQDFVRLLAGIVHFIRKGGRKHASERFDLIYTTFQNDDVLCKNFSNRFYNWLKDTHIYSALVCLGVFSRSGFTREMMIRIYERFMPSYKDLNNLNDIFLYIFESANDHKWLETLTIRQWLNLHNLIKQNADENLLEATSQNLEHSRLHALEMLSIWIAAEELNADFILIEPKLMQVGSAFLALQREITLMVEHYRGILSEESFDTAHIAVMIEQSRSTVDQLRKKAIATGVGSSIKMAYLIERLFQTLDRLELLLDIQISKDPVFITRQTIAIMNSMTLAAVEQHSTSLLRRHSIKMLARSISNNSSTHGGHYITRSKKEYLSMLKSAAGGGILIAFMALNKIYIGDQGFSYFVTSLLSGLNYSIGFVIIYMLHFTVATKQPAMTAANIAEKIERSGTDRTVDKKLAGLLVDVFRSQSVAVFGNVSLAIIVSAMIAVGFSHYTGSPVLTEDNIAYQLKTLNIFTQPTLWYAAIAGFWLFCSGIISGYFDNRANYLNLRKRLTVQPFLKRAMPENIRNKFANYIHNNYGSLMGNFIFGMLLGLTGWVGHTLGLPLDIRHVAFSSANLGYVAFSGDVSIGVLFLSFIGVLMIGAVNLFVSFSLALMVALRSRDTRIGSISTLIKSVWNEIKSKPLNLIFPIDSPQKIIKNAQDKIGKED